MGRKADTSNEKKSAMSALLQRGITQQEKIKKNHETEDFDSNINNALHTFGRNDYKTLLELMIFIKDI